MNVKCFIAFYTTSEFILSFISALFHNSIQKKLQIVTMFIIIAKIKDNLEDIPLNLVFGNAAGDLDSVVGNWTVYVKNKLY
jgi:hypothetical protein